MAPPRKKRVKQQESLPLHARLPLPLFEWLEQRAKKYGWPMNRTLVHELGNIPHIERLAKQGDVFEQMQFVLNQYGARITLADLSEDLLAALDEALEARPNELQAKLDRLRVLRHNMRRMERMAERGE